MVHWWQRVAFQGYSRDGKGLTEGDRWDVVATTKSREKCLRLTNQEDGKKVVLCGTSVGNTQCVGNT